MFPFVIRVVNLDAEEDSVIYKCCNFKLIYHVKFKVLTTVNLPIFDSFATGNKVSIALVSSSSGEEEV
jgi:hypothetical protein